MIQESILRAKPAVALVTARVDADAVVNCGRGPVSVSPSPFVETGTGWFIDGRGYLITNAHVVDPALRLPRWVTQDLARKAIDKACVDPALAGRGLGRGERPDLENEIRGRVRLSDVEIKPARQLSVLLSSGKRLSAEVEKFSAPMTLDARGAPTADSGRDLVLLRVPAGTYPALEVTENPPRIGDAIHIIGFPGVVLHHELLNQSASLEASVTTGTVSGFKQDAIGQEVIQTDAPAASGNSGGPALGNRGRVNGVLTFVSLSASGESVQGFNFLIPAREVRKFLQGTAVINPGESRFSTIWDAGLRDLQDGRFARAAKAFAEADALLPGLPDVKRALAEAEDKVANPPPRPFPLAWGTIGVCLATLGGLGVIWGRRWWNRRHHVRPTKVIELTAAGRPPVLVDSRTQPDYDASPLGLPRAVRLSLEDAETGPIDLAAAPNQTIVVYCASPGEEMSARVARVLRRRGLKNVRVLAGGIRSWTMAELPLESKSSLPTVSVEIYKSLAARDVERRRLPAGKVIFEEGENGNEAYLVHSGTVEIRKHTEGADIRLTTLGEGDLFGELALFRDSPRPATASAVTDVELLVLTARKVEWLMRNRPQLMFEILKRLSEMSTA